MNEAPRFLDLFAGAGGLSEGFIQAGYVPVAHVDSDQAACFTLRTRMAYHWLKSNGRTDLYADYLKGTLDRKAFYAEVPSNVISTVIHAEIGDVTLPDIFERVDDLVGDRGLDVIVGGPPCQAYSLIGRSRVGKEMKSDKRNYLYNYYAEFLKRYAPRFFVFENVIGLLSAKNEDNSHYFDAMKRLFRQFGYESESRTLSAEKYGVLQRRRRIILVGRKGKEIGFYPEPDKWNPDVCVKEVFVDLPALAAGEGSTQPCDIDQYCGSWQFDANVRDVDNWDENPNFIPDDLSNYKVVRKGQFAMNKMKAWQGSYGVSQYEGIVSPAYFVFDVNAVMAEYFHVTVRSKAFVPFLGQASDGVRIGQWDLSQTRMREIPFWVPPLPEQAAIVRYLDHIDERVRRYITGKQKLLRLLKEEKQAVIRRAVTRGLDQGVRLSPSGNEWLGDMPAHWASRRLKTICSMNSGNGITATSIESSGRYPVYGGNGLRGYSSHFTHEGEFALIGRQGALCGNVHIARGRFWASEHAVVATLHSGQVLEWFEAILEAMNLNQYSIAAAQPGLAVERILNLWIPVPPPAEQAAIATRIEKQTGLIDTAIERARRQIELMQEYRTRIIADVVTGKLDVRGTEAELPHHVWRSRQPHEQHSELHG